MRNKKTVTIPKEKIARVIDKRSLLERAAQDDALLAANYELTEDKLLQCLRCDHVTRQPINAKYHLAFRHPEIFEPPAEEEQAKEQ